MQAVILVAGKSKRFYPYVGFEHKAMTSLLGKPLLFHTLQALKKSSVDTVVIVVKKDSAIPGVIGKIPGMKITYVIQENPSGMGDALLQAEKYLEEKFFLLSGYHMDIADVANSLIKKQKKKEDVVLLLKEDASLERYGLVTIDKDKVTSITEKPEGRSEKALRVISMYLLSKAFLSTLKSTPTEQYHFEKALDTYAKTGHVNFVLTTVPTLTLKHSWDLLSVKDYLLSKIKRSISPKANIAKSAIIEGDVIISDNVRILEGACIKGPCFMGENSAIGNNAILRNGVIIEEHVVVGANMEVKNSVLMAGSTTHTGYIGDSVIGPSCRLAAGFCSANVRFDRREITAMVNGSVVRTYRNHLGVMMGEKCDLGINVSTMPGVTLGNRVTIGPETVISENVEHDMLMYTKFTTVVKKKNVQK